MGTCELTTNHDELVPICTPSWRVALWVPYQVTLQVTLQTPCEPLPGSCEPPDRVAPVRR